MKTNHRRGFVAPSHRAKGGTRFEKRGEIADVGLVAVSHWDVANGHRGQAKSVRGAKKFVNSRFRFHENRATRHLAGESED
jgi:hypothetical protein